jgi:NADH:ubiquinone oxidoreductase subunit 3 (subunit A)
VHGSHGDLEQPGALDVAEGEGLALVDEVSAGEDVAPQRVIALRPELVEGETPRIGVAGGDEAEEVPDLALEAARREGPRGGGRELAPLGRDRDEDGHRRIERRRREDVREREVARRLPRVGGGDELDLEAEGAEPIGEAWVQFPVGFYLVALIFIVFDALAIFLFPWALVLRGLGMGGVGVMALFMGILGLGWVYALREGILEWK